MYIFASQALASKYLNFVLHHSSANKNIVFSPDPKSQI